VASSLYIPLLNVDYRIAVAPSVLLLPVAMQSLTINKALRF